MKPGSFQKASIILMLGLLTASAFFIRLENFKNTKLRSIDEVVYYRMAKQILDEGLSGYNTMLYGKEMADAGRPLPEYFFQPLFKHPPVFTFLVAFSMSLFGSSLTAAGYVALALSALMIPLIYLLGSEVFDKRVGILSALFLWMDPVNIICSQKVWMDTPIAFFTLLSALFFVWGIKRKNDWFYILSGLASGVAVNTKYTGALISLAIFLFSIIYRRDLFKNKKFSLSLILPFILLMPWIYWNFTVYGFHVLHAQAEIHVGSINFLKLIFEKTGLIFLIALLLTAIIFLIKKLKNDFVQGVHPPIENSSETENVITRYLSYLFVGIFFVVFLSESIWKSLQFGYLPHSSWSMGFFSGEPPQFYFKQLIEFSLIYIFSFLPLFYYHDHEKSGMAVIRLIATIILIFFMVWGSYQSRYILSAIPFLIILSFNQILRIYVWISSFEVVLARMIIRTGFVLLMCYGTFKTHILNILISYPNDMCYF